MSARALRCAIYTRKSSEEGLDQAFNSLDAQRQAGVDYISSQKHQGWVALPGAYDDGGYSGGTIERPGLQRLLADVDAGRVDVVVVYKVDRLSRSLADFARIMQRFDERSVSFVSVTQQFNTTNSMGRLTLNMLLSFAQFEREVAGERIRDKIAATKRTGVWVCGQPPLGYRIGRPHSGEDRRLWIVPEEAKVVRAVFTEYLKTGSLLETARRVASAGYTTKRWVSSRNKAHGGKPLDAQYVHRLLTNPVYIGKITHTRGDQTDIHPGLHEAIIEPALWKRVRDAMDTAERRMQTRWTHTHLLKGKIKTQEGFVMSPSSVQRPEVVNGRRTGRKKLVRYYVSQKAIRQGYRSCPIRSINAKTLDDLVRSLTLDQLASRHRIALGGLEPEARDRWIREALRSVVVAPDRLVLEIDEACVRIMVAEFRGSRNEQGEPSRGGPRERSCSFKPFVERRDGATTLTVEMRVKSLDGRRAIVTSEGRDLTSELESAQGKTTAGHLVRAIGQAFTWLHDLCNSHGTVESLAREAGVTPAHVCRMLQITRLSPRAIRAALTGELSLTTSVRTLLRASDAFDWARQDRSLEFLASRPALMTGPTNDPPG